ncbi:cuticle protein 7 [Amyelois transitella]|uniref:cuticle protein 7 n=1 Tax=Amyelois transitella TaxID=680683 RepID=UPI0029906C2C|nr:cuticle protein 7 [Amyelois transitella]
MQGSCQVKRYLSAYPSISCLLAAVAVTTANPPLALSYAPITTIERIPDPSYKFNYAVNDPVTGDNKGQWETRHGDVVHGAYSLVEPDGNIRVVEYTADPLRGFNAVVKRTGPNIHSVALPAVKPVITDVRPVVHAPVVEAAPIAPIVDIAPIAPLVHTPIVEPLLHTAPLIHHFPTLDYLPLYPLPAKPWLSISGTKYDGHSGNIVRRWAVGPIDMHGKTLTVKTKH